MCEGVGHWDQCLYRLNTVLAPLFAGLIFREMAVGQEMGFLFSQMAPVSYSIPFVHQNLNIQFLFCEAVSFISCG